MKKSIAIICLTFMVTQSCNFISSGTWKDENIDKKTREEISTLNNKLLKAVSTQDSTLLKSMFSDVLMKKSNGFLGSLLEQASQMFTSTEYRFVNQFHVKNKKKDVTNTVFPGINGHNDYILKYKALNKEMYVALLVPQNGLNEFLVTCIYGKYPEGWKINILQFGGYTRDGKTATQLYELATRQYQLGYLIDAANSMVLSEQVMDPSNSFLKYNKEKEMKEFKQSLIAELNRMYQFPMTMEAVKSKPQIINIYPMGVKEGYFPMIEYVSMINLKDTARTKKEFLEIHESLESTFKGITTDKQFVFYKAYAAMPDGKTPIPTFTFVHESK